MVTRFADGIVDAITDSVVPELPQRRTSSRDTLEEMMAVREASRSNRNQVVKELKMRRRPVSREQLDIAVRRAIREVAPK